MAGVVFTEAQKNSVWSGVGGGYSSPSAGGSWLGAAGSLFSGFLGGGSGSKQAAAAPGASSYSGMGGFGADNEFSPKYKKPLIDLTNPVHILAASALLIGGIYAYKRFK